MLEVKRLAVTYGQHRALKGVDLQVAPGEIVVILGANGAGKTSLLKAVAGMIPSDAGSQVRMDGAVITGKAPHGIVEAGLALVPEGRGIFGDLTVRENLALGGFARRAREQADANRDRVLALFPRLGERSAQLARTMSGGEQQMVAIGRALMSAPSILMLDEPSLGLSPMLCIELFKNLRTVREAGVGILLVEQNARQSLAIADRAYLLENGEIVGAGPADQLARDPAVQAAYLGGAASQAPAAVRGATASASGSASGSGSAPGSFGTAAAAAATVTPVHAAGPANATTPAQLAAQAMAAVQAQRATNASPSISASADSLVPTRISELVRLASQRQADELTFQRSGAGHDALAARALQELRESGTLDQAMARLKTAAAQVRTGAPPAATAALKPGSAPALEVWHRPGLEVYRRGDDGTWHKEL